MWFFQQSHCYIDISRRSVLVSQSRVQVSNSLSMLSVTHFSQLRSDNFSDHGKFHFILHFNTPFLNSNRISTENWNELLHLLVSRPRPGAVVQNQQPFFFLELL